MTDLEIFLRLCLAGLAIILTGISLASYHKVRGGKLALATLGFCLFAIGGTLFAVGAFIPAVEAFISMELFVAITLVALIFFYLSILKR